MLANTFDPGAGLVLEGTVTMPALTDRKPVGLFIEHADRSGTALLVRPGGVIEIGSMQADGAGFAVKSRVDRELSLRPAARFRLLMKYSLVEFYLDDHLIQCWSVPGSPTGRIGLIGRGIDDLHAWQ